MHLKIQEHPPGPRLVNLLKSTPPRTEDVAKQWFSILASRVTGMLQILSSPDFVETNLPTAFSTTELKALAQTPIIPVKGANGAIRHLPPVQCYFKGDSKAQFHSKLFTFVDFGTTANTFLSACGVKHEPSVEEIAKILLDNPRQFYALAEGREKYVQGIPRVRRY